MCRTFHKSAGACTDFAATMEDLDSIVMMPAAAGMFMSLEAKRVSHRYCFDILCVRGAHLTLLSVVRFFFLRGDVHGSCLARNMLVNTD